MNRLATYHFEKFMSDYKREFNPLSRDEMTTKFLAENGQTILEILWGRCSCGEDPNVPFD